MAQRPRAIILTPGEGHTIKGPVGGPLTFKARADETNGTLTAFENVIPPGQGPPLHTHAHEDETWYVLEGQLRFALGDTLRRAPAGSFVFVPRGTPHTFQAVGGTPARILVLFTPAGVERFFERFASLSEGAAGLEAFERIGREVDMDVLGPPLSPRARIDASQRPLARPSTG